MSRLLIIILHSLSLVSGEILHAKPSDESVQKCIDRVAARYAPVRKADLGLEQQFQADLTLCESPSMPIEKAGCIGATNFDYTRLAMQLKDCCNAHAIFEIPTLPRSRI